MTDSATDTPVFSSTAPEPGQLVEMRCRQWIVSDADASAVWPALPKRNLKRLASIDEDALGDEIEVLWKHEPGTHVIKRAGLPTLSALDDASKLEAFLDAVLWGAATNVDRGYLQAPFRSGMSIEDYQGTLAFVGAPAPTSSKTKAAASARKAITGSTNK